jgi:hypothetical protein
LKRAIMRVARAMATATATARNRAMAINGDNTGNGYGKETIHRNLFLFMLTNN